MMGKRGTMLFSHLISLHRHTHTQTHTHRQTHTYTHTHTHTYTHTHTHTHTQTHTQTQHLDFYQYSSLVDKLPCLASLMGVLCNEYDMCSVVALAIGFICAPILIMSFFV